MYHPKVTTLPRRIVPHNGGWVSRLPSLGVAPEYEGAPKNYRSWLHLRVAHVFSRKGQMMWRCYFKFGLWLVPKNQLDEKQGVER